VIGWRVSILWGVENCPFPLTKPVAVNTGLALPRSLWSRPTPISERVRSIWTITLMKRRNWYPHKKNVVAENLNLKIISLKNTHTQNVQTKRIPFHKQCLHPIQSTKWQVGCEINVPLSAQNRLYRGQGLWWRFSSIRLMMANDTVTYRPPCLFVQRRPKMGNQRIGEAHLSYYNSAYKRVETNQPPQDH